MFTNAITAHHERLKITDLYMGVHSIVIMKQDTSLKDRREEFVHIFAKNG